MGMLLSALNEQPVCFDSPSHYDARGRPIPWRTPIHTVASPYYDVQKKHWQELREARTKSIVARKKLSDENTARLLSMYPQWTDSDIADLKDQFHSFDVNQDGMIDFEEMVIVLDSLGDETSREQRKQCFAAVDTDHSGFIDFEEFLELVNNVTLGRVDDSTGLGKAYKSTARSTKACYCLDIDLQLKYHLI
ncbi:hypothetical protein PTSG_07626 [Salpingoeca rosetta]|uniref:EF-hand domain-containing protein n=1 Tax=Salpingoeca rosetta (strain ATCC 50818 / BSB-021) TaxID=946362 RepID=F2UHB0_SALR5|nr:uncharacterized protein PTSG_07626 [Salpingoeca rosetta]EGD76509.1 hypothetical protein PTSG_07626 [Salpingoeca rosetta]|eukprot:XP_004991423.1 hypothetical protein PTSG_07626 [Salpingoeca rosetta]